ncbi:MAG: NUDIX domain-containing protein [archaeon]
MENRKIGHEKSAGAVIYYSDHGVIKFLMLKYPTYWGFAKGWIEQGETVKNTAIREIGEETGLKNVELIKGFKHNQEWFFRDYKDQSKLIKKQAVFFLVKVTEKQAKEVKVSEEHEDFLWLNYEEALKKIKVKHNKEMIKKAYEHIKKHEAQQKLL